MICPPLPRPRPGCWPNIYSCPSSGAEFVLQPVLRKHEHSPGGFEALRHMYAAERIVDNVEGFLVEALRAAQIAQVEAESVRRVDSDYLSDR